MPARPAVRDFTGADAPSFAVEWDVRPAFDFLISLSSDSGTSDDLPAADREWLKKALASLPKDATTYLAGEHRSEDKF